MGELAKKHCLPCQGGVPPMDDSAIQSNLQRIKEWKVVNSHHLEKDYRFKDFVGALEFVNQIGEIAEAEAHHPNLFLTWGHVKVQIWTHKIDGLTESDFILADKIDELPHSERG